mmetsp:Transcript_100184/g.198700  ORF Transcript_100184/g.198700 Transcript_100184/m.198700 type:complete len:110 (+) Transcript_100184:1528-1857(+)
MALWKQGPIEAGAVVSDFRVSARPSETPNCMKVLRTGIASVFLCAGAPNWTMLSESGTGRSFRGMFALVLGLWGKLSGRTDNGIGCQTMSPAWLHAMRPDKRLSLSEKA